MEMLRKDVIQNIMKSCKEREVDVTADFVHFVIQLVSLNPDYTRDDEKIDVASITKVIVNKLTDELEIAMVILKMQHLFNKYFENRDSIISKYRQNLRRKTKPLMKEICETVCVEEDKCSQKLYYQKIMVLITLLSGLGKPIPSVLREVETVSQNVFQQSELSHFLALSYTKKEEYLIELMCIVAGIRIFNKDCENGGEGIEDLPVVLEKMIGRTKATIVVLLEDVMSKVYKNSAIAEQFLPCTEASLLDSEKETFFSKTVRMLTFFRQEEICLRKILAEVETSKGQIKSLLRRLRERLLRLHEVVLHSSVIATSQVYPQFVDLADTWLKLQDEVVVLSRMNNFLSLLRSLCTTINLSDDATFDHVLCDGDVLTDAERLEKSMGKMISDCGECKVIYPITTKGFEKMQLEFLGFCPRTFVVGKGVLMPGNPNMGVVEWEGKYFAFSSRVAAQKFGEDPNGHIKEIYDLVRKRPEYVHFFQIYSAVEKLCNFKCASQEVEHYLDRQSQTDVHILPPHIDSKYSSNIWEHRRRALQLVRIFNSATRSTQTYGSHFRSEFAVQVASPKSKEVQTRTDNSTNTRKVVSYIPGLRSKDANKK